VCPPLRYRGAAELDAEAQYRLGSLELGVLSDAPAGLAQLRAAAARGHRAAQARLGEALRDRDDPAALGWCGATRKGNAAGSTERFSSDQ